MSKPVQAHCSEKKIKKKKRKQNRPNGGHTKKKKKEKTMIMALASLAACPTLNENLYCFHRELGKSRHPHSFGSNVFTRWGGLGKVWDTLIN